MYRFTSLLALLGFVACDATGNPAPQVTGLTPRAASNLAATRVSISGEGFFTRVRGQLGGQAPELSESFAVTVCGVRIADGDVMRVDSSTLSVVVPPGLPVGSCEVTVRVPDGQRATLIDGLTVTTDTSGLALTIENAAGGAGLPVVDCEIACGEDVAFYAVFRDAYGVVVDATAVNWTLEGDIGELVAERGVMATLVASRPGSGTLRAIADGGQSASAGVLRVVDDAGLDATTIDTGYCGNDFADAHEACDGTDLRGETCLSRGYLAGGGVLACDASCAGFDASGCAGGTIDSVTSLRAAVAEAYTTPGHEVLALQAGTYALDSPLTLDECAGSCADKTVFGVTLRPLGGVVTLTEAGGFSGTAIRVVTGQNVIEGLSFSETEIAIDLAAGTDAGGNVVRANAVTSLIQTMDTAIAVASDGNFVEANAITYSKPVTAPRGIAVSGDDNTIVMNAIYGRFTIALALSGVGASGGMTTVDHNTVWGTGPSSTTVVSMTDVTGLCYRNNIVYGAGAAQGLALDAVAFSATCGVASAQNNVNHGDGSPCAGAQCALYCSSGGMCDRDVDPALAWPSLCVPKTNTLVDSGLKLGYDMWDGDAAFYNGAAPEVGAREQGVTRAYGGTLSSCP